MSKISVIVRQRNEVNHLQKLFTAVRAQKLAPGDSVEIVVIDSGSSDGSVEVSEKYADKLISIKPESFTFGYSLNQGIQAASGDILVIVSAHTYPTSNLWIQNLVAPLSSEKVCMTYGKQVGSPQSNPAEIYDFHRNFGDKTKTQRKPDYFTNNANSAIKKKLWEKHPFDESLSGLEDIEWARYFLNLDYELVYVADAEIVHIHNESPKQIQNRYYREALALRRMALKRRYHLPLDLTKGLVASFSDLAFKRSAVKSNFKRKFSFHYNKLMGHARGILKGRKDESGLKAELQEAFKVTDNLSLVVRGPGSFGLENLEVPQIAPHEVLLKPAYVGICGTDREIISGRLGYYASGVAKYPIVLGHEYSASVVKVGSNVKHLKIGDQVVGECILSCGHCGQCSHNHRLSCPERQEVGVLGVNGALASLVKVPGQRVHIIPQNLPLKTAVLTEPTAVVIHSLKCADLWNSSEKNSRILITGLGSIGQIAAQLLKNRGYNDLSFFDISKNKLDLLPQGSGKTYNDSKEIPYKEFDVIIDYSGNGDLLNHIFTEITSESKLLLVGFPYENAPLVPESIVARQLNIIGSLGATSEDFQDAMAVLPQLQVQNHLKEIFKITDFEKALEKSTEADCLKCVIQISDSMADEIK